MNFELAEEHELIRAPSASSPSSASRRSPRSSTASSAFPTSSWQSWPSSGSWACPSRRSRAARGARHALVRDRRRGARADRLLGRITVAAHTSLGTMPILLFGTEEQKRHGCPISPPGRKLAAFGLTEPGAGSDAGATQTRAELRDGEWVIDGSKIFITNAGTDITACVTITALTGEERGLEHHRPERRAGLRASRRRCRRSAGARPTRASSPSRGARCPRRTSSARAAQGFNQFLEILDGGRISVAAMAVGLAQGAYDLARRVREGTRAVRSADRRLPGGAVQARRHGRRDRRRQAAHVQGRLAQGPGPAIRAQRRRSRSSSPASCRTASSTTRSRSTAATASWTSTPISRLYRDQKILEIGEGTNEVQRMVIARHLGLS